MKQISVLQAVLQGCVLAACVLFGAARADGSALPTGGDYRIYVTNEMSGDLSIIDGRTHAVTSTLELGKRPRGVRASADGTTLFVALSGSPVSPPGVDPSTIPPADKSADGIGIVDTSTRKLIRVLRGFSDPEQLAISQDGARIFVASEDTGMAIIADARSGNVLAKLAVGGEPEGVSLSSNGRAVYVTSEEDHRISVIDTATSKVATVIPVGQRPRDIAFSPDGTRAYVSNETDASITVIDATTHRSIRTVEIPGDIARPMGVVVSPDNATLYTATGRGGTVVAVDTKTFATRASGKVGERPWGIAISPDGRLLYTANGPSHDVSILDAKTLAVLGRVKVGQRPWGLVVVGPHQGKH